MQKNALKDKEQQRRVPQRSTREGQSGGSSGEVGPVKTVIGLGCLVLIVIFVVIPSCSAILQMMRDAKEKEARERAEGQRTIMLGMTEKLAGRITRINAVYKDAGDKVGRLDGGGQGIVLSRISRSIKVNECILVALEGVNKYIIALPSPSESDRANLAVLIAVLEAKWLVADGGCKAILLITEHP